MVPSSNLIYDQRRMSCSRKLFKSIISSINIHGTRSPTLWLPGATALKKMGNNADKGKNFNSLDGLISLTHKSKETTNGVTNKTKFYFQPITSLEISGHRFLICWWGELIIVWKIIFTLLWGRASGKLTTTLKLSRERSK